MATEPGCSPPSSQDSAHHSKNQPDDQCRTGRRSLWPSFVVLLLALSVTTLLSGSSPENSFYKFRQGLRGYIVDLGPYKQVNPCLARLRML